MYPAHVHGAPVVSDTLVLLITKNRLKLTEQCTRSLLASDLDGAYWLAIDNGSTDGTIEHLKSLPRINQLICNPVDTPQWQKSFAINQAVAIFRAMPGAEFLSWVDDDMVLKPDWLVVGKQVLREVHNLAACSLHNDELQEKKHQTVGWADLANGRRVRLKKDANGAVWVVRKSFFDEFGLPPVKGVGTQGMSDWHYCSKIKPSGRFIAVVDGMSTHLGYKDSLRMVEQTKAKSGR